MQPVKLRSEQAKASRTTKPCSIFDDPSQMLDSDRSRSSCEDTHNDIDNTSMILATEQDVCRPSNTLQRYIEQEVDDLEDLQFQNNSNQRVPKVETRSTFGNNEPPLVDDRNEVESFVDSDQTYR